MSRADDIARRKAEEASRKMQAEEWASKRLRQQELDDLKLRISQEIRSALVSLEARNFPDVQELLCQEEYEVSFWRYLFKPPHRDFHTGRRSRTTRRQFRKGGWLVCAIPIKDHGETYQRQIYMLSDGRLMWGGLPPHGECQYQDLANALTLKSVLDGLQRLTSG